MDSRVIIPMTNPLLVSHRLPPFAQIQAEHVEPAVDALIEEGRTHLSKLLAELKHVSWQSLVEPLESQADKLNQAWSPVSHLNSVVNSDELREAYNNSIVKLTAFSTEMSQNSALYKAYEALANSDEYPSLSIAQQKTIDNALRDFRLAGVALSDEKKQRYGEIAKRLSELQTQFSNNVLDATQAWHKHIESKNVAALVGLPEGALAQAAEAAKLKSLEGYVITLDIPSYLAVMTYADDRALRQEMYRAYSSRASKGGQLAAASDQDVAGWDNSPLIEEILALRHEKSLLLDFNNYAEFSLASKMAEDADQVEGFLTQLAESSVSVAHKDMAELAEYAKQKQNLDAIEAWDIAYFSEKLREEKYSVSQEELKPYFPSGRVVEGLFKVVNELYDIDVEEDKSVEKWHDDVQFFNISRQGKLIASFYLDLFARNKKRGGAWMDDCRARRATDHGLQLPVAYLTCNFTPPVGDTPALLTHDEVVTLFHEFGHGLHHMLSKIEVASVSGINGVPWDAVELPSQFLENWCWEKSVVPLISGHYETGEVLPSSLLNKLLEAKNFQSGMAMVRQLEFALFDFRLHRQYNPNDVVDPQEVLDKVRNEVAVVKPPAFNKFQNGFGHIFAGGYAAGYYSYKWAEVLSADAFSLFEEEGVFNKATGEKFLTEILERGGSEEPMTLFKRFRGREPEIGPLLRHSGISTAA